MKQRLFRMTTLALTGITLWAALTFFVAALVSVPGASIGLLALSEDPAGLLKKGVATVVKVRGASFAIDTVVGATQKRVITSNDCQEIMRLVGHAAYTKYGYDLDKLFRNRSVDLCLDGYLFGIESEILDRESRPQDQISGICTYVKTVGFSGGQCMHSVGHAVLSKSGDLQASLTLCDSLGSAAGAASSDCYNGVFNRLLQDIVALDRGLPPTGHEYPQVPSRNPYAFCDAIPTQYRDPCYAQLAQRYTGASTSDTIQQCLRMSSTEHAASICIRINAAVSMSLASDAQNDSSIRDMFIATPDAFKPSALMGIHDGYLGASRIYDDIAPWKDICVRIVTAPYSSLCVPETEMAKWQLY